MRHHLSVSMGLLMVLLCATACHPKGGEEAPTSVLDRLTQRDRLYDVAFAEGEVWAVGFPGLILHSPDSGKTWEGQAPPKGMAEAFFDVEMLDANQGWIVGRNGVVLQTKDRGETWTRQDTPTNKSLYAVDFLDAQEGWAVGEFATVLRTTDGGETWTLMPAHLVGEKKSGRSSESRKGRDAPPTAAAEAEDEEEDDWGDDDFGDAPDTDYGVDGGDANEDVNLAGGGDGPKIFDRHLGGVYALGQGTALAAGESGVVLRTDDGGTTWSKLDSGEWATLYGIGAPAGPDGPTFFAGSSGVVRRSTDQGATWEKLETNTEEHLFRFAASEGRVFVVGRRGLLLTGALDAAELRPVPLGIWGWISGIAFGDQGHGVLVGGQGLVMTTTDGGQTWRRAGDR